MEWGESSLPRTCPRLLGHQTCCPAQKCRSTVTATTKFAEHQRGAAPTLSSGAATSPPLRSPAGLNGGPFLYCRCGLPDIQEGELLQEPPCAWKQRGNARLPSSWSEYRSDAQGALWAQRQLHLSTEHLPLQPPPCLLCCCGLGVQAFPWVTQDNRVTPWEADMAADRHFLFFLSAR